MMTQIQSEWQQQLRVFKEKLAERLWALPTVSETEKEQVFKEYLRDLDEFENVLIKLIDDATHLQNQFSDENQLLRRLMGLQDDELRNQNLTLGLNLNSAHEKLSEQQEELRELRAQNVELKEENASLRQKLKSQQDQAENIRVKELKKREDDIRYFSEEHRRLQINLNDLETRITNLKQLYTENNQKLLAEKQGEIALLQKNLIEDMSATLKKKQHLMWAEEEMFAQGVAHRVRTALVSAQGQLTLTLERLGLLDPQNRTEMFWKPRLNLLIKGAGELGHSFRSMTEHIQAITRSLDDYLHLTGRKELSRDPIDLKDMLRILIAQLFGDQPSTLNIELLSDDPLPIVEADRELIQFILRSLLQNAFEALANGTGLISVHIKNCGAGKGIQVWVRDTGTGIPKNIQERLFQPFLTTKEGRSGFSLSRSKRYAELHNGSLTLVDTSAQGSLFQLELPLSREG